MQGRVNALSPEEPGFCDKATLVNLLKFVPVLKYDISEETEEVVVAGELTSQENTAHTVNLICFNENLIILFHQTL